MGTDMMAEGTARTKGGLPRVVIVGAGFGGLSAVKALGNTNVDVLLLSRTPYHGFWMLLYQVAAAQLEAEAIATPVRAMLRRYRNVRFQVAEVCSVDFDQRLVHTDAETIPYDYLILAAGSTTHYFGNAGYGTHALGLHDVEEAERLRDSMLAAFECASREPDPRRRAALMTVVLVGGGPTGVELAGAFAELIRGTLARDYPGLDPAAARVVLVEASGDILGTFPAGLRRAARQKLAQLGVELQLGTPVTGVEAGRLSLGGGASLEAETIIWAAGVRAVPLAEALGVALGRGARVPVRPTLDLPAHAEVFVVGDMAYLERDGGEPFPMVAQVAMQMGKHAGRTILTRVGGHEARPFSYFDFGQMAMVGRGAAVFESHGLRLRGPLAWLIWLAVHLAYLPGFRNRLITLLAWLAGVATGEAPARGTSGAGRTFVDARRILRLGSRVTAAHPGSSPSR